MIRKENIPIWILDRYLMRHFLVAYAICSTSLLSLFVVLEGVSKLRKFMNQEDTSLLLVLYRYFSANIPVFFCQYLGPVFTMMACLFSVTMLNRKNEILPMRATGMSMQRIMAPYFVLAVFAAVSMVAVQEYVVPDLRDNIRQASAYGKGKNEIEIKQAFTDSKHRKIEVKAYNPSNQTGRLMQIREYYLDINGDHFKLKKLIRGELCIWRGETDSTGHWELINVNIKEFGEDGFEKRNPDPEAADPYSILQEKYRLETSMRPIDLEAADRDVNYLSLQELRDQYKRTKADHLLVKIHRRFAFPIANIILILLGLPLVFRGHNASVVVGIGGAILISAAYLISDTICTGLGNDGTLPPTLAAWLPVIFWGALGFTLFDGIEKK